ncbi:MAG: WbqC family protein [Sulfuricurvum sp.]|uniref:WbqC family protein n=1 Tax=Sulfuricurvum sp. TaxID=2025608 RepID=UPI003D0A817E
MNVAIMQPYFFPYLGYIQLIAHCDLFVFFDVVQYNQKSWMSRNRILHPDQKQGFQYINVPVKKQTKGTYIKDTYIDNTQNWQEKIRGQLSIYKKLHAPFYTETLKLLESIFQKKYEKLLDLNQTATVLLMEYLDIGIDYKVASELQLDYGAIALAGDWAFEISKALNAKMYTNPYSGYEIFDEEKFTSSGIQLTFLKSNLSPYKQSQREPFIPGLSIVDILMFYSKEDVKNLILNDYKLYGKKDLEQLLRKDCNG